MSRAIIKVSNGQRMTINEVGDVYGSPERKQRVLDGLVDGVNWVYEGEEIAITASQAPKYMDDKLKELIDRENAVEKREQEIHTRFTELAHKEVAYETRLDELNRREATPVKTRRARTKK